MPSDTPAPTRKQLAFLRRLAQQTGTTFTLPASRRQASAQIAAMLKRPVSNQLELALDDLAVRGGELREAPDGHRHARGAARR